MQIVYVQWRDSSGNEGWHNEQGIEKIKSESVWIAYSVGWLVDQTDDRLIICGSMAENGSCGDFLKIPAEAITDLQILTDPEAKE